LQSSRRRVPPRPSLRRDQVSYFTNFTISLIVYRLHKYSTESFNGATLMIARKKSNSIKLKEKTEVDLWNLEVDHGQGYDRFAIKSRATIDPTLSCLMAYPNFPFNGIQLYRTALCSLSSKLPQIIYTMPINYLRAFINIPVPNFLVTNEHMFVAWSKTPSWYPVRN
jgi:hypothetical protein